MNIFNDLINAILVTVWIYTLTFLNDFSHQSTCDSESVSLEA